MDHPLDASAFQHREAAIGEVYAVLDLVELDEGIAYSQLDAAIAAGRAWAGFCYKPHHLFTMHPEMTLLTEPAHDAAAWNPLTPEDGADWMANSSVEMAWPPAAIQPVFATSLDAAAPLVAGLLTVVIVPVLKVLAQEQDAQRVFDARGLYRISPGNRLVRWLW
jgi:ABC-type proline/glycine betaine transport system substrate-binding protein